MLIHQSGALWEFKFKSSNPYSVCKLNK